MSTNIDDPVSFFMIMAGPRLSPMFVKRLGQHGRIVAVSLHSDTEKTFEKGSLYDLLKLSENMN